MTSHPRENDRIDPAVRDVEDLDQTDVDATVERDPDTVPNADYSDPETRPAVAPDESED